MMHFRNLAMHQVWSALYRSAKSLADALQSKAYAEDWDGGRSLLNQL